MVQCPQTFGHIVKVYVDLRNTPCDISVIGILFVEIVFFFCIGFFRFEEARHVTTFIITKLHHGSSHIRVAHNAVQFVVR